MIWIICGIVLLLNEYSSGERWHLRLIRNLCAEGVLWGLSTLAPGLALTAALMLFSAVTAAELYRCSEKRREEIPGAQSPAVRYEPAPARLISSVPDERAA